MSEWPSGVAEACFSHWVCWWLKCPSGCLPWEQEVFNVGTTVKELWTSVEITALPDFWRNTQFKYTKVQMQNNQNNPWKCKKEVLLLCAYWSVPGICFHFAVCCGRIEGMVCGPATFPLVVVEQDYVGMYFVETFQSNFLTASHVC